MASRTYNLQDALKEEFGKEAELRLKMFEKYLEKRKFLTGDVVGHYSL